MSRSRNRNYNAVIWLAALVLTGGCEAEKSRNPLSPDVAGPIPGVVITDAKPLEPTRGYELKHDQQPVELLFENALTNGERPIWHVVEVASDAAFSTTLYTADRLEPGENGQTRHRLPASLALGRTYYWRVRAQDGANTGPFSDPAHFKLLEPVIVETPRPVSPIGGNVTPTVRPQLVVENGAVSGPAGPVQYRFEVARDQAMADLMMVLSVPRSGGATTSVGTGPLASNTTFYWRVYAVEPTTTSPRSAVFSFRTPSITVPAPLPPDGGSCPVPPGGGIVSGASTPNRFSTVQAVAAGSSQWAKCQQGSGLACHLFTREVAVVLHKQDKNWGLLSKSPGEWQCTSTACGPISCGYGEDVIVYRASNQVVDIVVGAGGPGASVGWQLVSKRDTNHWVPPPGL